MVTRLLVILNGLAVIRATDEQVTLRVRETTAKSVVWLARPKVANRQRCEICCDLFKPKERANSITTVMVRAPQLPTPGKQRSCLKPLQAL